MTEEGKILKQQQLTIPKFEEVSIIKRYGLFIAPAALIGLLLIPVPAGPPVAGQRMLALLAFSVI